MYVERQSYPTTQLPPPAAAAVSRQAKECGMWRFFDEAEVVRPYGHDPFLACLLGAFMPPREPPK